MNIPSPVVFAQVRAIYFWTFRQAKAQYNSDCRIYLYFLCSPDVHLAIHLEYSMKHREVPCPVIGTFDGEDINYALGYLTKIIRDYHGSPNESVQFAGFKLCYKITHSRHLPKD